MLNIIAPYNEILNAVTKTLHKNHYHLYHIFFKTSVFCNLKLSKLENMQKSFQQKRQMQITVVKTTPIRAVPSLAQKNGIQKKRSVTICIKVPKFLRSIL